VSIDRRSFLKLSAGAAALGTVGFRPVRGAAQDKRTIVVAWDTDIDTLDPAQFKAIGGYVTIANCYDTPIAWKVQPIKDKPEFALSRPAEWDGAIAESWATERDGATIVLKVRKGVKFPSGRRSRRRRSSTALIAGCSRPATCGCSFRRSSA